MGADNRWVETHYYGGEGAPHDPFAGTSRTHELLLEFHADNPDFETVATVHADFQSPPLVYSGLARYRDTGVTLPLPDVDNFPKISKNLDHFTDSWLFHQRYWNWYGIWDYGDVQHWSDGNHEERQTTFAEYRLHYYLSGEGRSRDVMMKLSDYYADFRLVDDRGRPTDLSEGVNTKNMFFHNFGAMHGVFEYYRATGDDVLRAAVVRSARATLAPGDRLQQGSASMGLLAGFAAMYGREDDRFRDLILADMSDPGTGSRDAFRMVLPDPQHWTGETASLSRQSPLC